MTAAERYAKASNRCRFVPWLSTQCWEIGERVNVGFVRNLVVVERRPYGYLLETADGSRSYDFAPYRGLCRI